MFSTPQSLERRTGKNGMNRYDYLNQLIDEYETTTTSVEYKEQIIANLANFSYDPINYEYFRRLNIIDVFINILKTYSIQSNKLISYAISAICNLCLDDSFKISLIKSDIVNIIIEIVLKKNNINEPTNDDINLIVNSLTIVVFLRDNNDLTVENHVKNDKNFVNYVINLKSHSDKRLANISNILLDDFSISQT